MDSLLSTPKYPITTQLLTEHHPITASRTLGNPETAKEYWYNTTDVYTFDYFQSVLLFDEYCLDIGIVKLRLDRHLNGNPICIMAKHSGRPLRVQLRDFPRVLVTKVRPGATRVRRLGGTILC